MSERSPRNPPYLALLALDAESTPVLQALSRRLPAGGSVALAVPTPEAAVARVRETCVTLFLQGEGPTGPLGRQLIAQARAAGNAALRIGATGPVALDDHGHLLRAPGTRLGDAVEALGQSFELGLAGLRHVEVSTLLAQPGPVTAAVGKGTPAQAVAQALERMGQRRLSAARHVFLNLEQGRSGTLPEAAALAKTVQAAVPAGVTVEFGAPLTDAIRDGAARVLLLVAEG